MIVPDEFCAFVDEATRASFLARACRKARDLDYVAGMMQWNQNMQIAVPRTDEK
jgi:hypothetical protein